MLSEFAESKLEDLMNVPPRQADTPDGRECFDESCRLVRDHCGDDEETEFRLAYRMSRAAAFPNQ